MNKALRILSILCLVAAPAFAGSPEQVAITVPASAVLGVWHASILIRDRSGSQQHLDVVMTITNAGAGFVDISGSTKVRETGETPPQPPVVRTQIVNGSFSWKNERTGNSLENMRLSADGRTLSGINRSPFYNVNEPIVFTR